MNGRCYMVPTRPYPVDNRSWLSRWSFWITRQNGFILGPNDPRLPLRLDARLPWHRDFLTWCLAQHENVRSRDWLERTHEKSESLFWSLGGEIAFHCLSGVFFTAMDNKQVAELSTINPRDPDREAHALAVAVRSSLLGIG